MIRHTRSLTWTSCALAALTLLAACDDGVRVSSTTMSDDGEGRNVLKVIDTLQCPQTMGDLTRKGPIQENGTVCTYVGPRGAEVRLHLVRVGDRPVDRILSDFESRLSGDMEAAVAALRRAEAESRRAEAESARAEAEAGRASAEAHAAAAEASGDQARVDLPGIHIDADGENASVRIGGIHIDANEKSADIDISAGGENVSIQAEDNVAEVRSRASGEALRASWQLSTDEPSQGGLRMVGYEARGPAGGPIVIATIRSKTTDRGSLVDDARDLVTLNVGE